MRRVKLLMILSLTLPFYLSSYEDLPYEVPYADSWKKGIIKVLEVHSETNWEGSGWSDEEAFKYCKNTHSLPKDSKQMEEYLKKHFVIEHLHDFNYYGCEYQGKVEFDGRIWNFWSAGGITTLTEQDGNKEEIRLVCQDKNCRPRAMHDDDKWGDEDDK